jgi:amino acid permease
MSLYRSLFAPVGILAGTIIGAGVFALPRVFVDAGLSLGFVLLALGAFAYTVLHLAYADVVLGTEGNHRFLGYVRTHLGRWAVPLATIITIAEVFLGLTIYLVLAPSFIAFLLPEVSSGVAAFAFWVLGSIGVFLNLRKFAFAETLVTFGIVLIITGLAVVGLSNVRGIGTAPWFPVPGAALLALSPILFALGGRPAIPTVLAYLKDRGAQTPRKVRSVVLSGTLVPALTYALFVISVVLLSPSVSEDAVTGIASVVPKAFLVVLGILGILSLWSSYIAIGLDVAQSLRFDMRVRPALAYALVLLLPIALYLAGLTDFILLVSIVGGIFLALESLLILLMWRRLPKTAARTLKTSILPVGAGAAFLIALGYELSKLIG